MAIIPIRIRKPAPIGGINTVYPADHYPQDPSGRPFSPRALNVRFRFGSVRSGPGRSLLSGPVDSGPAQNISRYYRVDNQQWPILLTSSGIYRWGRTTVGSPRQWHKIQCTSSFLGSGKWGYTSGEGKFFFSRPGESKIFAWDGDPSNSAAHISETSGVAYPGKILEYFNNRLICAGTSEGGFYHGNRIRYSVNADYRNWGGTGSGFVDLWEPEEEVITGLLTLGARCAVYRRHSIGDLIPTGTTSPVFQYETRSTGEGCAATWSLASAGQVHFFLGPDKNVLAWDGVNLSRVSSEKIDNTLRMLIADSMMNDVFSEVFTDRHEYWLVLPSGEAFIYDYRTDSWSRDSFGDITALGEVIDAIPTELDTWELAEHSWTSIGDIRWNNASGTEFASLFAGRSDSGTFLIDENVVYDYYTIGSIVDRYVETEDMYFPSLERNMEPDPWEQGTVQRAIILYEYQNSEPFEFSVSCDRGNTWDSVQVTPNSTGISITEYNITGPICRFRFRENNADGVFRWNSFGYEFIPAGPIAGGG